MVPGADFASTGAESERAPNRAFLLVTCLAGTEQEPRVQVPYSEQGSIKGHRQCTRALDARELAES